MPTTYIPTIAKDEAHREGIWSVAWASSTDTVITGSLDCTVKCWDGATGDEKFTLEGHNTGIISVDTNKNGTLAVSTSLDSNVRVWDLENEGKLLHNILAPPGEAWTAKCSPDGTLIASGSYAGNVNIYKIDSGEQVSSLSTKKQFIMSTAYSADGKYLACGAESGSVYVFDVETSQLVHTLSGHTLAVRALSFAADCRTLISGSDDKRIHVYDVEHGQVAAALTGHNGWVLSVPSNPNISKQQIASSSSDKQVKIWDLGMRQVIETHEVHTDQVWGACWNSEGTKLVSASDDKSIKWFAASGSA
ncbi:Ski complex subunit Rec14 [Umbelopsis nana]